MTLLDTITTSHSDFRGGSGTTRKSHCGRRVIGMDGSGLADIICRGIFFSTATARDIERGNDMKTKVIRTRSATERLSRARALLGLLENSDRVNVPKVEETRAYIKRLEEYLAQVASRNERRKGK